MVALIEMGVVVVGQGHKGIHSLELRDRVA